MTDVRIEIEAGALGLVFGVGDDGRLHQLAFGPGAVGSVPTLPVALHPLAYPTFGEEPLREPALRVTHADGATSTRLVHRAHDAGPHADGRGPEGVGSTHRVELADRVAPLAVTLVVRTWPAYGLLEQWVEVANEGDGACTLHQAASAAPAFSGPAPHLTHWGGGWAHEWTQTTEVLTPGTKSVWSAGGVRPSLYLPPVVLLSPDGPPAEREGRTVLATVAWGGDVRFDAEVAHHAQLRLIAGSEHRGAERHLAPGDRWTSPPVLWAWSDGGTAATSHALHRFAREQVVRGGTAIRATVANTWEAMGFALDPTSLAAQADAAADVGAELFLLDDGWFGHEHPRDDDTSGLGDWSVDVAKLPDGLQPVIDRVLERGMRFGLWVEPEMVNPRSGLYQEHPDWVIGEPGRERREERQQLVLDLCRPEVAAYCVEVVDRILRDHPGITYLKWDANRDVTEPGSQASSLPPDRQSHLPQDRVRATWRVMEEVARRHPDVELMLCASGGGRSDLGTLRSFHELWTSDDTDPVDRVRIQWGASHLLPASVLGAHATRWGVKPFPFACAVAMSGRFGFDVDLVGLTDDERAVARAATATYAGWRQVVQQGDIHRLVSPVDSSAGSLAFVDPDDGRVVAFAFRLDDGELPASAPLADLVEVLPAGGRYTVTECTPGVLVEPSTQLDLSEAAALGWPDAAPGARIWELRPLS